MTASSTRVQFLPYRRRRCEDMGVRVHALSRVPDHVSLVRGPPIRHTIPDFVQALKGDSAHFANWATDRGPCLYWQSGYGMLTFSQNELECGVGYVDRQKRRHQQGRLWPKMERTEAPKP